MINLGILTGNHFPNLGGMEFLMHSLAEELQKRRVNTSLACNSLKGTPQNYKYNYNCYRSKSFSYLSPILFNRNQIKMIREQKVNLLHGTMIHSGGYWAFKHARKFDIPFVAHSHGADVQIVKEINYGDILNQQNKSKFLKVANNARYLIAVSSLNKKNISELGVDSKKIKVINNGLHVKKIEKLPFKDLRNSWGFNQDDFVIISVGRNKPIKRMELLFRALFLLRDKKKIKCVIIGPSQNIKNLVEKFDLVDSVHLTGRIPNKRTLAISPPYEEVINAYKSSNLYISTSYVESFGNAASEALACGIPILVGSKHGIIDVVNEGENGWIMSKEKPNELAELILHLFDRRFLLKENILNIKQSVKQLDWSHITPKFISLYNKILSE